MKILIIYLCFFTAIVSAQEERQFEIKDNLYNVGLFNNISLSDNLTVQNGLSIRKSFAFATLDVPIILKYDISNEWTTFIGAQTSTVIKSYLPETSGFEKPSKSNMFIGTEYEFKNDTSGYFNYGFSSGMQLGLKF